jgi:hypothetical protein
MLSNASIGQMSKVILHEATLRQFQSNDSGMMASIRHATPTFGFQSIPVPSDDIPQQFFLVKP